MSHGLESSIPAQKSQCPGKSKDNSSPAGQIWTAARCRRLLQPLFSGLGQLKEEPIHFTSPTSVKNAHKALKNSFQDLYDGISTDRKRPEDGDDCWRPGGKRVRRTYSSRHKVKEHDLTTGHITPRASGNSRERKPALKPGEVLVPTPLLRRAKFITVDLNQEVALRTTFEGSPKLTSSRPYKPSSWTEDMEAHLELAESMYRIRTGTETTQYEVCDGIFKAFDALLRATSSDTDPPTTSTTKWKHGEGSRSPSASWIPQPHSLFAICLRKVPEYIEHEKGCTAVSDEQMGVNSKLNPRSMLAKIYSSLESLGTSGSGWRHFRMVLRAQAVLVIKNAISQRLITAKFAGVLVMLCVYRSALDEAGSLLTALLTSFQYPNPISTSSSFYESPLLQPLCILADLIAKTGREGYYCRQLTELVTRGLLPVPWLATKAFSPVWTTIFRLLSNEPANQHAIKFIASTVPMICACYSRGGSGEGEQPIIQNEMLLALHNTLRSILITLSAMSLLNGTYQKSIISLTENILAERLLLSLEIDRERVALIAMTRFFAGCGTEKNSDRLRPVLEILCNESSELSTSQPVNEDLPAFICDVAHCLARGTANTPFEHLKILIEHMEAFTLTDTPGGGLTVRQLIRDCVFSFAQHQPGQTLEHVKYAQRFGRNWQNTIFQSKESPSILKSPPNVEFRWEEGISEWVTATPGPKSGKNRGTKSSVSDAKSDHKLSQGSSLKRRRQFKKYPLTCAVRSLSHSPIPDIELPSPSAVSGTAAMTLHHVDARLVAEGPRLHSPSQISPHLSNHSQSRRRGVNNLWRLGQKFLHSYQNWELDSDSDDELSIPTDRIAQTLSGQLVGPREFNNKIRKRARTSIDRPQTLSDVTLAGIDELGL